MPLEMVQPFQGLLNGKRSDAGADPQFRLINSVLSEQRWQSCIALPRGDLTRKETRKPETPLPDGPRQTMT